MQAGARRIMLSHIQLENYPPFQDRSILSIEPVATQGHCNLNYKVTTDSQAYLVRKLLSSEIDREKEYLLQQQAAVLCLSPKIIRFDREDQIMVMPFIEGEHCQTLDMPRLTALVDAVKQLHNNLHYDEEPIDLEMAIKSREESITEAFETIQSYPRETVICHNDLNPRNILWQAEKPYVLDFEYAGMNDCYFDLAAISVEFSLSKEQEIDMLHRYFEGNFFREKFDAYKVVYTQLYKEWFNEKM